MKEIIKENSKTVEVIYFQNKVDLPYRFHGPMYIEPGYYKWYPKLNVFVVEKGAGGNGVVVYTYTLEEVREHMKRMPEHTFYTLTFEEKVYREKIN